MTNYLSLSVGGEQLEAPSSIPSGDIGPQILNNALSILLTAGIMITVIFMIISGIRWITAAGDKEKIAKARAGLTWAIIGLVIMLAAFLIINIFNYALGINLMNYDTSAQ